MLDIFDTAYPRFKKNINQRELDKIYTPTNEENAFAKRKTRNKTTYLYFLIFLKSFQRLGYFVKIEAIPTKVIKHIAQVIGIKKIPDFASHESSRTRYRYLRLIRSYLNIKAHSEKSIEIIESAVKNAALVKEDLTDIINVAIEELVKQRYELPKFSTLRKLAFKGRVIVNKQLCKEITMNLTGKDKQLIEKLFIAEKGDLKSPWHFLKKESKNVTLRNIKERITYIKWIEKFVIDTDILKDIPDIKIKQFSSEAKSIDAHKMARMKSYKKYSIALTLITFQKTVALDDLGKMIIKIVTKIHARSKNELRQKIESNQGRTDHLINTLHQILLVHQEHKNSDERNLAIESVIGG